MNILFAITGIAFALFVAFYSVLIVKHRLQKDVNNDIYSSVDCVIYDEHNDWFNNLNCIRLIFEGLINVSKAGINFVLEIYKIKMALRSF